ncbi:MAG: hypothetical protein N2205_07445 [Candidatus Caldatribacterium sp.]|nr:hypothetical protein [Candidatus Caldatribacterium sp.]
MRRFLIPGMLLGALLCLSGCTFTAIIPVAYGTAQVCSGSPSVYGELYVDGRYVGYLEPNECLFVDDLLLGEEHIARVYHPWGGVYSQRFYLSASGQIVTID